MKNYYLLFSLLFFFALTGNAQELSYERQKLDPIPLGATINVANAGPGFASNLVQIEAPPPSGEAYKTFLEQQKEKAMEKYPRRHDLIQVRGGGEPPILLIDFAGNNSTQSTPMDNHLAVSNGGQVVSVINRHIAVKDMEGNWIKGITLENFTSDLGIDNNKFDPRIIYDLENDRFILFMISGNTSSQSDVIVAFSQTNDASGDWNLYSIEGNPFDNGTWTDYPMIAITKDEVFLTGNSVFDGQPWQTGFYETLIWQIDKNQGYNGEPIDVLLWSEVDFNGQPIRNLHPVKTGTGYTEERMYFLSNRNFAVDNDTVFILELTGNQNDPDVSLDIDMVKMDMPYHVPPNALQPQGFLQTNDARVLDAFLENDQIQFVHNCMDPNTGQAAIYHGIIDNVSTTRDVLGFIVNGGLDDLGYPGIAYTGLSPDDEDAMIIVSHSALDRFPGCSAMYFDNDRTHSELVTIKEGLNYISMIPNTDVERWGDYAGLQPKYDEPGTVWGSASFGEANTDNDTWIGQLARPDFNVSTRPAPEKPELDVKAFPNPTVDRVTVTFSAIDVELLQINLVDQQGQLIRCFHNQKPKKEGVLEFSLATEPLASGIYFIQIIGDGSMLASEKIVVE